MKRQPKFDENIITEWYKNCPVCNKRINYKRKLALYCSYKQNSKCKSCRIESMRKKITGTRWKWKDEESKKRCAEAHKNSSVWVASMNTEEYKKKHSKSKLGNKNGMYGKTHTLENKHRMRETAIERMKNPKLLEKLKNYKLTEQQRKKHIDAIRNPARLQRLREHRLAQIKASGTIPSYNENACNFFDKLNKKFGWIGQHALNGGEKEICGYSVDYFEPNLNFIIEWDEEYHFRDKHTVSKDSKRQNILIDSGVGLYRIREKTLELNKVDRLQEDFYREIGDCINEYKYEKKQTQSYKSK